VSGTPVGLLTTTRQFEEDEDAGYVRTLGVLPSARGRGVGTALLDPKAIAESRFEVIADNARTVVGAVAAAREKHARD
jgi:ribosomal protein S18 acetylase RimI-like enzyme